MQMEIIHPLARTRRFRAALFDFDGTLSLIREGWQEVMIPYFCEELRLAAPTGSDAERTAVVTEFVDRLTGKQTIYQCIALAREIERRGGDARDPAYYKQEYLRRLMEKIADRRQGLADGTARREAFTVRSGAEFVKALRDSGIEVYCASGTDQPQVREEAAMLGFDALFGGNIYGADDACAADCAKEAVIRRLLQEKGLTGDELLCFGDGFVEIELVASIGGYAVGVATDEKRGGVDERKRKRLTEAGASAIIPDFAAYAQILRYLNINEK